MGTRAGDGEAQVVRARSRRRLATGGALLAVVVVRAVTSAVVAVRVVRSLGKHLPEPGTARLPEPLPAPSPSGIMAPPPSAPSGEQPNPATPEPRPAPEVQPSAATATAPFSPPQQRWVPAPPRSVFREARPIFTPEQAARVVDQVDAVELAAARAQLRYLATWLRNDKACNDPESWPILQTSLATSGASMIPGGPPIGTPEVTGSVTNAQTNVQATDNIERYSHSLKSALPFNVKQQIVQALSLATSANDAYSAVQGVLQKSNTTLSQQALDALRQSAQQAEQAAQGRTPMPR